jgi:predicted metal-dependent peptidase
MKQYPSNVSVFPFDLSLLLFHLRNISPFFASLALFAESVTTKNIQTAATDGMRLFFNPDFMAQHTPAEQLGVLVHELLHAALRHVIRRNDAHPVLWNIAADIVVNGIIDQTAGLTLPKSALRDPQICHFNVEEVYQIILKRHSNSEKITIHFIGSDLISPGEGKGVGSESDAPPGIGEAELRDHWTASLAQAAVIARIGATAHGHLPANLQRVLAEISDPPLDWRTLLWRYLTRTPSDFTSYDRRFIGEELYLDAMDGESVRVAVCIDTSGSIGESELARFFNELRAILRAYPMVEVDLYCCDTKLHGPWAIDAQSEEIPELQGGGGTNFAPFFKHLNKTVSPDAAIYLTDGMGDFPEKMPDYPTLWVITPGGLASNKIPFGEVARMLD